MFQLGKFLTIMVNVRFLLMKLIQIILLAILQQQILYDRLKIYGNDFIMIGNYQHSFDTYPAYVRKSEMLADWSIAYSKLVAFEGNFYIHWSDDILKKRIK